MTIRDTLEFNLKVAIPECEKKSNRSRIFHNVLVWQELKSIAEDNHKKAWETIQKVDKLIEEDDQMRARGIGDHIIETAPGYQCTAKVGKGTKTFDLDMFIAAIAKKYKLQPAALAAIADECKPEGKARLTKRILEK